METGVLSRFAEFLDELTEAELEVLARNAGTAAQLRIDAARKARSHREALERELSVDAARLEAARRVLNQLEEGLKAAEGGEGSLAEHQRAELRKLAAEKELEVRRIEKHVESVRAALGPPESNGRKRGRRGQA